MWIADTELMWALTPFALSGVFMFVLALRSAKTFGATLRPHFAMSVLQDASRKLWSFAAIDIMGQVFTRIAVIGLMLWASERATGVYAAGLKLAELACMPLLFLGQAAYPALSRCFSQPAQFRKLSRLALVWGSLIALVIAAAMALLVPVLLVPLLGEGYAGSETIIASMAVLAFVQGLEIVIGRLLLAANLSVARAQWVSLGAVLCAVSTALLVPRFGVPAAIGATVTAYVLVDALYLRSLLRTTHRESFQSGMVERPTTKVVA
jgi:O-antigen/teichoic acid export membrane protein